jgi:6-phosphogluconolactonase
MLPEIIVDATPKLADLLAERLEQAASRRLAAAARFSMAVSGGSAAREYLPRIARAGIEWPRVDLFWCDERAVPPDHPESNYRLVREVWLDAAPSPPRVHPMPGGAADLDAAAAAYERRLIETLGRPPRLDVVLMGVGEDGHVCSLFPGRPLLAETRALVGIERAAPKAPPVRLTLTPPALVAARLIVVTASGASKARVLREALTAPGSALPLAQVLAGAARSIVLLDPEAASLLGTARP